MQNFSILSVLGFFVLCACSQKAAAPTAATANLPTSYSGHGKESLDSAIVKQFAPPALSEELVRQMEMMMDVREASSGQVSNNGKTVFFTWGVTGRPQVWKWEMNSGFPTQMTGGKDRTRFLQIAPNQALIALSRDRDGEENPGIYLQKTEGGKLIKVFHKKGVRTGFGGFSNDSRFLYFTANDSKPDHQTIYRFELANSQLEKLFEAQGLWEIADNRDDQTLLIVKWLGNSQTEYSLLDIASKKATPLLGQGKNEEFWIQFGLEPNEYFVLTNMFGDFRRLYRLKDGAFTPVTPEAPYDIESFRMDEARKYLSIVKNQDGFGRAQLFDTKTMKEIALKLPESDNSYFGAFSHNSRYLSLILEKSTDSTTNYVYDLEKKELRPAILPSSPEVDLESFVDSTLEYYSARDGTKIPMIVRRPLACKEPCPVVVHFHGGPEGQSRPGFSAFAQIFVDAGFVYVEPNVRGSDGYGKAWLHSDNGPKRLEVLSDIEDAARYIKENWKKNGQSPKVGVMGYSYGGYATLMAMTKFAGAYDAGVSLVGISNLLTFLQNTAPYRRAVRISEYGDPERDKEALEKLSATTYLDQVKDPLLIIQGVTDPRVPAGEALQIYQSLKAKNIPAELILFENEGHGSVARENRVLELGHTLGFFQKHLTP